MAGNPKQRTGKITNLYREREAGGQGRGEGAWSLLFAGGEFADLAGCGHALARGV